MNKRQMVNFFSENMIPFAICYMAMEAICKEISNGALYIENGMTNVGIIMVLVTIVCVIDCFINKEIYGTFILINMFMGNIIAFVRDRIVNAWQNTTYEMFTFLLFVAIFLLIAMGKIWARRYEFFKSN